MSGRPPAAVVAVDTLSLAPGDTLMVRLERGSTFEEIDAVRDWVVSQFPGVRAVILAGETELAALDDEALAALGLRRVR